MLLQTPEKNMGSVHEVLLPARPWVPMKFGLIRMPLDNYLLINASLVTDSSSSVASFQYFHSKVSNLTWRMSTASFFKELKLVRGLFRDVYQAYHLKLEGEEGVKYEELNNGSLVRRYQKLLKELVGEEAPEKMAFHFQDISYVEQMLESHFTLDQLPISAPAIYETRHKLQLLAHSELLVRKD